MRRDLFKDSEGIHDCSVNRMFMRVYNNDGRCCHILAACNVGEHRVNTSDLKHHNDPCKVGISILENTVLYANPKVKWSTFMMIMIEIKGLFTS